MATMTDELVYGYCEITKTEKTPDGLMIWGKAAGPGLDLDGQRFSAKYLEKAMPRWYEYGNIREQHSAIAAGVAQTLEQQGDDWYIKALIVDPGTIKKVEKKVLKGLSPGIKRGLVQKSASAPNGEIVDGEMVEISLVDRPSDPTNKITICKAAGGSFLPVDEEGHMLKVAEPDIIKSARRTVQQVLHEDLVVELDEAGDIGAAKQRIDEVCDLVIHTATVLKSAAADEVVDIGDLQDAVAALGEFGEGPDVEDGPDYDGIEADVAAYASAMEDAAAAAVEKALTKMGLPDLVKTLAVRTADDVAPIVDADGTLDTAEIIKAAVAEVKGPLEAKIESLQADLAKAMAAPRPGGPVLITQPTPALTKTSEADRYLANASRATDPELAMAYRLAAAKASEVAA